jgi:hypothetical protein
MLRGVAEHQAGLFVSGIVRLWERAAEQPG